MSVAIDLGKAYSPAKMACFLILPHKVPQVSGFFFLSIESNELAVEVSLQMPHLITDSSISLSAVRSILPIMKFIDTIFFTNLRTKFAATVNEAFSVS